MSTRRYCGWQILAGLIVSFCLASSDRLCSAPPDLFGRLRFLAAPSGIPGIQVTGPSNPGYRNGILEILPEVKDRYAIQPAFPLSFLVRNGGNRSVIYLVARYAITDEKGRRSVLTQARDYRQLDAPRLRPNDSQLITPIGMWTQDLAFGHSGGIANSPRYRTDIAYLETISLAGSATASIDSVMYDDETFFGPDEAGTFATLSRLAAEVRTIVDALKRREGTSDAAISGWLDQKASEFRNEPGISPLSVDHKYIAAKLEALRRTIGTDRSRFHASVANLLETEARPPRRSLDPKPATR